CTLHSRTRGARDRYSKLSRRQSATRVTTVGGRGKAFEKGSRDRGKAEVFEDALSRGHRQLAVAARRSAQELKAERLAEAKAVRNTAPPRTPAKKAPAMKRSQRIDRSVRTPDR